MKLPYPQLERHLTKNLAPIYLVGGNEILLVQEAIDTLRAAAIKTGFNERVSTTVETQNDLEELLYANTHTISLFENKKRVELNLTHLKFTATHGKILADYAAQPANNTLLLISTSQLDSKMEKTAWYKMLEEKSIIIPIWPIAADQLPQWIMQRAKKINLQMTLQAAQRLATLVEGNLLAAAQEIEKLSLLYPNQILDPQVIENDVMDHARFDIFNLVDSALLGNASRCLRILKNLASEGTEPTLILWALTRELRVLAEMQTQLQQGAALPALFSKARIWEKRQAGFRAFLKRHTRQSCWDLLVRAAKIDRVIKGVEVGTVWDEVERLVTDLS